MRSSGCVKQKRPGKAGYYRKSLTVSYPRSGLCRGSSHKHSQPDCGVVLNSAPLHTAGSIFVLMSVLIVFSVHVSRSISNYPCLTLCSVCLRSVPTWPSMSTCALVCVIVYTLVIRSHCFPFFVSPPLGAVSLSLYTYVSRPPPPLDVCAAEGSGAADGVAP